MPNAKVLGKKKTCSCFKGYTTTQVPTVWALRKWCIFIDIVRWGREVAHPLSIYSTPIENFTPRVIGFNTDCDTHTLYDVLS